MKIKKVEPSVSEGPPINKPRPKIMPPPPAYQLKQDPAHFILVKLKKGTLEKTLKKLKRIKGISGFHPVFGEFDLVIIIRERKSVNKEKLLKIIKAETEVIKVQTLMAAS